MVWSVSELAAARAEQLSLEWEKLAGTIGHNLTAGEARERLLRQVLVDYLPARARVSSGFVIDVHGGVSQQMDVVIYDAQYGMVFDVAGANFFPVETVIAVGEVKTDITDRRTLADCLAKIASVKSLDRTAGGTAQAITGPGLNMFQLVDFSPATQHRDQVLGFIFTASALNAATARAHLADWRAEHPRTLWPNVFCAWEQYMLFHCGPSGLTTSAMDATCVVETTHHEVERRRLLLIFMSQLGAFINEAHIARPSLLAYGKVDPVDLVHHEFGG